MCLTQAVRVKAGKTRGKNSSWYILQTQLPLHATKEEQGGSPQHGCPQHNTETVKWPPIRHPVNLSGTHATE